MILTIIILTSVISILALNNNDVFYRLKFNSFLSLHSTQWYRFFTYGFVHAGWMHLFINMFVLYSFGNVVIEYYVAIFGLKGYYYFVLLYIGAIMLSVLPSFGKYKNDPSYNAVGASGAVSAVVFASILFVPLGKIYLFFIPIGIPAFIFGGLYLVYSAYMAKRGGDNIGHDAHFWGALFGIVYTIALKPKIFLFFVDQIAGFLGF
jgi:membrane associated rhomboid family serine protease